MRERQSNALGLRAEIAAAVALRTRDQLLARLGAVSVPVAPVPPGPAPRLNEYRPA